MDMTRRDFIGTFTSAIAIPLTGFAIPMNKRVDEDWFEDIRIDRYYMLQGGQYGDTGGYGNPGYMWGPIFTEFLKNLEHCHELEDKLAQMEQNGYYFTPQTYLGDKWRRYDKMPITKDWAMEFYKRHKDETFDMWGSRYINCISNMKSGADEALKL